jgi:hypothetical protein
MGFFRKVGLSDVVLFEIGFNALVYHLCIPCP